MLNLEFREADFKDRFYTVNPYISIYASLLNSFHDHLFDRHIDQESSMRAGFTKVVSSIARSGDYGPHLPTLEEIRIANYEQLGEEIGPKLLRYVADQLDENDVELLFQEWRSGHLRACTEWDLKVPDFLR